MKVLNCNISRTFEEKSFLGYLNIHQKGSPYFHKNFFCYEGGDFRSASICPLGLVLSYLICRFLEDFEIRRWRRLKEKLCPRQCSGGVNCEIILIFD